MLRGTHPTSLANLKPWNAQSASQAGKLGNKVRWLEHHLNPRLTSPETGSTASNTEALALKRVDRRLLRPDASPDTILKMAKARSLLMAQARLKPDSSSKPAPAQPKVTVRFLD